jgi:hypothetical protein
VPDEVDGVDAGRRHRSEELPHPPGRALLSHQPAVRPEQDGERAAVRGNGARDPPGDVIQVLREGADRAPGVEFTVGGAR